jgi:endonuclease/exonuclease/phosphatase family metal-dependent hydrolase
MRRATGIVIAAALAFPVSAVHAQEADSTVTVMSRNIYLGADVAVALELIPDMPAAAQFMWDQVAATDFDTRVEALADELVQNQPDVVGIQEATTWMCRPSWLGSSTVVFNFLQQLLDATEAAGVPYVIAEHDGVQALSPGYSIPALPGLTTVRDPETFQPIFGADEVACGFTIGDALIVRADLADSITAAGTHTYEDKYAVVPVVFEVPRGYAWADLQLPEGAVRFVTTHLEAVWAPDSVPLGTVQARELAATTSEWSMPLVVLGDFNADPRDPRGTGQPNPGLQPDVTTGCAPQVPSPTASSADPSCNAYWTMVRAGFEDAGPDPLDPANATWGASALLAGPDLERLSQSGGNAYGYTDRLDYIFTKNGVRVADVALVGQKWPDGEHMWACSDPQQVDNARAAAEMLGVPLGEAFCLPTDHVGLIATLDVPPGTSASPAGGIERTTGILILIGVLLMSGVVALWAVRRSRLHDQPSP